MAKKMDGKKEKVDLGEFQKYGLRWADAPFGPSFHFDWCWALWLFEPVKATDLSVSQLSLLFVYGFPYSSSMRGEISAARLGELLIN